MNVFLTSRNTKYTSRNTCSSECAYQLCFSNAFMRYASTSIENGSSSSFTVTCYIDLTHTLGANRDVP